MVIHYLRISLFLCLISAPCDAFLFGQSKSTTSEPSTLIGLPQFGYVDPIVTSSSQRRAAPFRHLMAFDSEGKIIVGYVVHERNGLVTRDLPALSLHVVKFDPLTQRQIASATIATADLNGNAILTTAHDNILVKTNDSIELFSPVLQLMASKKVDSARGYLWSLIESTDKSILLVTEPISGGTKVESINPENLEQIASCNYPLGTGQIKDVNKNGDTASTNNRGSNRDVVIRQLCETTDRSLALRGEGRSPFFLTTDKLLLSGFYRDLQVKTLQGDILFEDRFGSNDIVDSYAKTSSVSGIFAVSVRTLTGGSKFLDIDSHLAKLRIVVYRLGYKGKSEITLRQTPKYYFDFDFSPDGKAIAVLCDGVIQIYKI